MFLYRSNRAEHLIDALGELLADAPLPALATETIIVQSRGMERWVSMELSTRLGIWANGKFPFPRGWLDDIVTRVLADTSTDAARHHAAYAPEAMQWSIATLLPTLLDRPEFQPVAAYLGDTRDTQRLLELSRELATLFDQYLVFRPAWIENWRAPSSADDWQATLWRTLVERHGEHHGVARAKAFQTRLQSPSFDPKVLPARVILFAVSTLPPLYVDMLSALSTHMQVHWFLLSPCREYYADIRPEREILRARSDADALEADALHLTEGQALLASWGLIGRELHTLIDERCPTLHGERDLYVDPGIDTLLHTLQSDMLHLRDRRPSTTHPLPTEAAAPLELRDDDCSLSLHACHSEMREVEVLHDQLIDMLECDPTLSPQDILVMAPDIDRYAPVIDAVFADRDGAAALAYHISERKLSSSRPVLEAFDRLLSVLSSRFGASEVLDLLSLDLVRERFGLDPDALALGTHWLHATGVRWAIDEAHRAQEQQPALRGNTWGFGLDRLMLGYAMDGDGQHLAYGVLPYDDLEGNATAVLGQLADFCQALFSLRALVHVDHTLDEWRTVLSGALATIIHSDAQSASDHRRITQALQTMTEHATLAGFTRPVPLATVRTELGLCLERGAGSPGFLSAGVTFCRMVPMRSIPFRVIALLGMGASGFPRGTRPNGLDRMQSARQLGDRSSRDDDRQLLLEVLLSVRERLIVTYVGQGIRDNRPLPPSVLVDELLDWCERALLSSTTSPHRSVRARLVQTHPLQPWHRRYFGATDDPRWFSYRHHHAEGCLALLTDPPVARSMFSAPLVATVETDVVTLRDLEEAILSPAKHLLRHRLGLRLDEYDAPPDDREPMVLGHLERHQLAAPMVEQALRDGLSDGELAVLLASGHLPLGTPGTMEADALLQSVRDVVTACASWVHDPLPPLPIDMMVDDVRVTGVVGGRYRTGQLHVTYSKLDGRALLVAWIRHLAVHARDPHAAEAIPTRVVGRSDKAGDVAAAIKAFAPMAAADAQAHLRALIDLRRSWLRAPSAFDAKRGYAYATAFARQQDHEDALRKVRDEGERYGLDRYTALAFDGIDPLTIAEHQAEFIAATEAVLAPLLQHIEDAS